MVDAYNYAMGIDHKPRELKLADYVQEYGAQAVLGRPMYAREILRCTVARNVYRVKIKSFDTDNWAKWAKDYPRDAELLASVERLVAELEDA
jgi:hypothetical protein